MTLDIKGRITLRWVCPSCEDNNQVDLNEEGYDVQNMKLIGWSLQAQCQNCHKKFIVHSESH